MKRNPIRAALSLMCLLISLALMPLVGANGDPQKDPSAASSSTKKKHKSDEKRKIVKTGSEAAQEGHPILWEEPTDIESRDLFYGSGGQEGAPDPAGKFTFVERSTQGTSKKLYVEDDQGHKWTVKFGAEAKSETAASRIVWAVGYHVDQDYFVKQAHIEGAGKDADAQDVRFERRNDGYKEVGLWTWEDNPFLGTRELQGLKVLMVVLNNWDLKTDNNKILRPDKKSGGDRDERIYYVGDLGATFGKTGSILRKVAPFGDPPAGSKGKSGEYAHQDFIEGTHHGEVIFHYKGKGRSTLRGITVENAQWMGNLLGRLSEKQLSDAFRAGGFDDSEVATYVRAIGERIRELQNLK